MWALHRYSSTGRRNRLAGFAAAFLLAGLSNGHFFYFFAAVVVIVAGLELLFHVRSRPRMLIELPVATAVMFAAGLPVMSGYLAARDLYGMQRSRQEVISYAANTVAWLDPGFFPPLYWFFYYSGALESFDDYDYGDVLRGLRTIGVRYVTVQTDPALVDADKGRATLRAIRRQPDQVVTSRDFGETTVFELPPWDGAPPGRAQERPPMSRSGLAAATSHSPDELIYAFDDDTETRWLSGRPQAGNESITIQLDQPTDVSHLRLTVGRYSFGDYPRHLIIESTADGLTWESLHSGRGFERLLAGAVPVDRFSFMDFPLPPNASHLIRLRQTGNTPMFYWSFHEMELWERE